MEHITVNNPSVGRSVDEAKRLLQAVQFVAEHGEVRTPFPVQPYIPCVHLQPCSLAHGLFVTYLQRLRFRVYCCTALVASLGSDERHLA